MKKTLYRILYKYYLIFISFNVWYGAGLVYGWYDISERYWGVFMVISGVSLLCSEIKFIKKCNKDR